MAPGPGPEQLHVRAAGAARPLRRGRRAGDPLSTREGRASRAWAPLAGVLAVAGTLHLVRPEVFTGLVPRWLGDPEPWVYASGAAEIACAAGLVVPRTRRLAGWVTAALFVAVFPGNVTMAVRAWESDQASTLYTAVTLARLPLQVPLVWWAVRVARAAGLRVDARSDRDGGTR